MAAAIPELTIASTALGIGGSLFGGKKKKTEYTSTKSPQAQALENSINQYYQNMMRQPTPYTPMNSMSLQAANMLSNAYTGQPYTQYGIQTMPQGQYGMTGQMQQPQQQAPQGGMPSYLPQMMGGAMSGGLYGGGNVQRFRQ